jgi:hypothetical protein
MFDVSSFYRVLACNDGIPFTWKSIWLTKVPLKTFFFFSRLVGDPRKYPYHG